MTVLVFSIPLFGAEERAFYALSSLEYCLDNASDFNETEIATLFDSACLDASISEEIENIRPGFDDALTGFNKSLIKKKIKSLRKDLQKKIFADTLFETKENKSYPNLYENPLITSEMRKVIMPYCLPLNHHLVSSLNALFSKSRVSENEETFANAGFTTLFAQPTSYIRVARHAKLPGYLLKIYLDSENRLKEGVTGWKWLVNRCIGAENVRKLIQRKKIKYFSVPDKWIYPLPGYPQTIIVPLEFQQPILLIVTDMNLVSDEETIDAWKNKITRKHLDELFCILSHGFSSCYLATNIPFTKSGKFTCIDTEHPKRKLTYNHVKAYLSKDMQLYWNKLIKTGGKI
jgi:hypothetical protein